MTKIIASLLAGIYPILFFYHQNQDELSPRVLIGPLVLAIGLGGLGWLGASMLLKNKTKGSLWATAGLMWFFSYGHLTWLIKWIHLPIGGMVIGPDKILLTVGVLLMLGLGVIIGRGKSNLIKVEKFVRVVLVVLTGWQLATIFPGEIKIRKSQITNETANERAETGPDIYFLIVDAYGREDVLKNLYDYDNGDFLMNLEKMGMVVVDDARSNYAQTFFSLAATLNMEHVNYLGEQMGKNSTDVEVPFGMIENNKVAQILKNKGYRVINLASGWGPTDKLTVADTNYDEAEVFQIVGQKISINEFYIVWLQSTALSPFVKTAMMDQARAKVLYAFDKLTEIPYQRGKKLVIAHFNVPHPPYLFDKNGDQIPEQLLELAGESFGDREHYLEQLQFVNKKLEKTIASIINNSSEAPIVILQSDHGPASVLGHPYKWIRPAPAEGVKERMSILTAYFLPKKIPLELIPKTPVNSFRFIFNNFFGENYAMLPETSYFSDYKAIYEFFEVTNTTKENIF